MGAIKQKTDPYKSDESFGKMALIKLRYELYQINVDMMQPPQSRDIEGTDALSGFLMHVNEALTCLILSKRGH